MPVQAMLDYPEDGGTIDAVLACSPSVTRERVVAFLDAKDRLVRSVGSEASWTNASTVACDKISFYVKSAYVKSAACLRS